MSSSSLKEDIKLLEKMFLKKASSAGFQATSSSITSSYSENANSNENFLNPTSSSSLSSPFSPCCFRLISSGIDELICELTDSNSKKYRINANICVSVFSFLFFFKFEKNYNKKLNNLRRHIQIHHRFGFQKTKTLL